MGCNFSDSCSECMCGGGIGCDMYEGPDRDYDYDYYDYDDYSSGYEEPSRREDQGKPEDFDYTPSGQIHWSQAPDHIGEWVTLFGKVGETYYDQAFEDRMRAYPELGLPYGRTCITVGRPWPNKDGVTLVIWPRNRDRFDEPEKSLLGNLVSVRGRLYLYNDRAYIELRDPSQLTVFELPRCQPDDMDFELPF